MFEQVLGVQGDDPYTARRRSSLAQALIQSGFNNKPRHWMEGVGNLSSILAGSYIDKVDREDENKKTSAAVGAFNQASGFGSPQVSGGGGIAPALGSGQASAAKAPDEVRGVIEAHVPEEMRQYAMTMAGKESSFNPGAVSPTGATGLFQFTRGTGRDYGLVGDSGDRRGDAAANTQAFVKFTGDNREKLRSSLGRDPSWSELALAHQQGAGGAINLLSGKPVDPRNLAVNNIDPASDPRAAASKIMSYYGLGKGAPVPPTQRPVQIASANPGFVPEARPLASTPSPEAAPIAQEQAAPVPATPRPQMAASPVARALVPGAQPAQAPAPAAQSADGSASPRVRQLFQAISNPYLPPQMREVGKMMLQAEIAKTQRDPTDALLKQEQLTAARRQNEAGPLDLEAKRLQIEDARRRAGSVEMERIQGGDGMYYERPKGTREPFKAVDGIPGGKPKLEEEAAAREKTARSQGLKPGDPAWNSYILTGKMPREDQAPLSATDKKAILEADEMVASNESAVRALNEAKALSSKAYDGPTAGVRAKVTGVFGSEAGQATQELDNIVTSNALTQLKGIFGGAPTEGERKILLDIQGSVNQPAAVREKIYERARIAAEKRLEFNRQRAGELRDGSFYRAKPSGNEQAPAPKQGAPVTINGFTIREKVQ